MAYSDAATQAQLAYLEALHKQLRGEVTPAFTNGLNRGQASAMIDEAKGLLLQKEHERLMAAGLPVPPPAPPAPVSNVVSIPTDERDEWVQRRREEAAQERAVIAEQAEKKTAHNRLWYAAAFGHTSRDAMPEIRGSAPIKMWMARPPTWDCRGYDHPAEWRWQCIHPLHGHMRLNTYRGGTVVNGWSGCLQNAINHYQKYHCDPRRT